MKDFPETEQEAREQARELSRGAFHVVYVIRQMRAGELTWHVSGEQAPGTKVAAYFDGKEIND